MICLKSGRSLASSAIGGKGKEGDPKRRRAGALQKPSLSVGLLPRSANYDRSGIAAEARDQFKYFRTMRLV